MNLKLTGNNSAFREIVLFHGYFFSFHSIDIWMKIFATFVEVFCHHKSMRKSTRNFNK